ncbi:serine/threonine-protein kinase [Streptomyces sp. NPDC002698]|uniref:serine/threonine-protein kinase n=1 Tax=Streptomyces sp. NPDC002698 TaxID=3364660 RepID=UPI0036B85103
MALHSAVPFDHVLADRYELTKHLGGGGMGDVWAGFDRALNRGVAVKLLKDSPMAGGLEAPHERFVREARLLARIGHPAIPVVHDVGVFEGHAYMVMQLIHGMTLGRLLREEGRPGIGRALRFAAQICDALSAAHRRSVVHRDLKPENLMIDPQDTVWLLDFGVAASLAPSDPRLTSAGMGSPGTAEYAAPEQHLGEYEITGACDLYSLGCVIHELVTGQPLFTGSATRSVGAHHVFTAPAPLRDLRPASPVELERLVLTLLAKEPGDRPSSAEEVKAVLDGILLEHGAGLDADDDGRTVPMPSHPRAYAMAAPTVPAGADPAAGRPYAMAPPTVPVGADMRVPPTTPLTVPDLTAEEFAALRSTALTAYLDGHHAEALPGLERLRRRADRELGPGSAESIDLGLVIADIRITRDELAEAEACLRELRLHCPAGTSDGTPHDERDTAPMRHLDIAHMLGQVLHAQGDPEGLPLLTGTHASLLPAHGPKDPEVRSLRALIDSTAKA